MESIHMRPHGFLLTLVVALVVGFVIQHRSGRAAPTAAAEPSASLLAGFDVENPQWMTPEQQDAVLAELRSSQVPVIRFPLVPSSGTDYSSAISFTEHAFEAGIRSDVIISPSFRSGAPARPIVPGTLATWPQPGLSSIDPELTGRRYKPVFDRLDRDGIVLAGIEVGNEINWPPFNGDLPVPGTGHTFTLYELQSDRLGRKVAAGFRAYLAAVAVVKALRDRSSANKDTPIILAGLAEVSPGSPPPAAKIDDVDVATTVDFMEANGADHLVDAYAVHTYVAESVTGNDAANRSRLNDDLDRFVLPRCGHMRGGKPCWITEWGAIQPMSSCPFREGSLPAKLLTFLDVIKPDVESGRVSALFYADWGDAASRGLYRCGTLSAAGRLYLHFFARTDAIRAPSRATR